MASNTTIYPDSPTLVQASSENPITVSVGNDTLRYGTVSDDLSSTLAAGQSLTLTATRYIKTDGDGAVVLRSYDPWEVLEVPGLPETVEGDITFTGDVTFSEGAESVTAADLRVVREAPLNVKYPEFGAEGDGTTDDSVAVQAALNAAGAGEVFFPPGTYVVDAVDPPSGVTIRGAGTDTVIKQKANSASAFDLASGTSGVTIRDLVIDGNSANIASTAVGIQIQGSNHLIDNVGVYDAKTNAIQITDLATHITIRGCRVYKVNAATACAESGIVVHATSAVNAPQYILVEGCHVEDTTMTGIGITGIGKFCTFANNITDDTGEDGVAAYNRDNYQILAIGNNIRSPGNNGIHLGGNNFAAVGNVIENVTVGRGIVMASDPNGSPTPSEHVVVSANLIDTVTLDGILVQQITGATVTGNRVESCGQHALSLSTVTEASVTGNVLTGSTTHGIACATCVETAISGNVITDNSQRGITVVDGSDVNISGNVIEGSGVSAIRTQGTAARVYITANNMRNNVATYSLASSDTTSSVIGPNHTDATITVASAATIALPHGEPIVTISGTADITTITAANHKNHRVTLVFSGTAAATGLTDGSNLKLNGSFAYTPDDTITLIGDGTNWYEASRSAN